MDCLHCGLPVAGTAYPVCIDGVTHETCCRGCQAVAQTIADSGLGAYYSTRSALPPQPQAAAGAADDLEVYDLPAVQRSFVHASNGAPHEKEAALLLDGVTCAACLWLIEQRLARHDGVAAVTVNYATRRLSVRWNDEVTKLSRVLSAVSELGYRAEPYDSARAECALRAERRAMLWRLFVSGFAMMQVMMYALPAYVADDTLTADADRLMRFASIALTLPVVLWAALPFYRSAWRQLAAGQVGMDVPITLGIIVAFGASLVATVSGVGAVYYDSVSMFVFLLLGARFLELGARAKAASAQERLLRLAPAIAERLEDYPRKLESRRVPAVTLEPGDFLLVRPGASIPADGTVVDGASAVDESLITGEARPARKAVGDGLIRGAVNTENALVMEVERVGPETVLAGIVRLMDRALGERPRVGELADTVGKWFVAGLLVFAVLAAAAWYAVDPSRALWIAIAILVVSCPCALSLATPAALTAATGSLYRSGVLVTRGHALETLAAATHYVFDKTGTLTTGRLALVETMPLGQASREACLALAAALEARSEHPIAKAIAASADSGALRAARVRNLPGKGVEGIVDGRFLRIGTMDFVAELHDQPWPDELPFVTDDLTVVALGDSAGWLALLTFGEALRPDARRLVTELKRHGKAVSLLSGDRQTRVERLARELGIAIAKGDATPDSKLEFVRSLQRQGAIVAMVGDGVNDAPVLAQAQVSVAVGGATQLAQATADVIVMADRLEPVLGTIAMAGRTLRVIRQNLAWAVLYNAVAVPLAATGYVTPLAAAAGMSVSSLAVVLNALRLAKTGEMRSAAAPPLRALHAA
ncbi:MAG: heavy metal translocating P-type ATPase [Rhodospirillaceae bacterium]